MSSGQARENGKALTIKTAYAIIGVRKKGCIEPGTQGRKRRTAIRVQQTKAQPAFNIKCPMKKNS
jgi:hypothetical protein